MLIIGALSAGQTTLMVLVRCFSFFFVSCHFSGVISISLTFLYSVHMYTS